MRIALFQPDIPQNTGNILRLAACFNIKVDIIEPAGFIFDNKKFKRSVMDYYKYVTIKKHIDWESFYLWTKKNDFNLILLTTKGRKKYTSYSFKENDILILGRESAGAPKKVHQAVNQRLIIPMNKKIRSFNVSSAAAIVLSEALRQLKKI
tara:strand:+ start:67 stop:519 length:453 start_codon:yes stop_codon:yes gene_type:complete